MAAGYSLADIAACTELAYAVADDVKLDAFGVEEAAAEKASRSVLGL